ncbi:hypothetical protein J3R82DRAFT_9116 [Butyriboletus roseoflavus]|nr:hypothetical protein J3R82DRAFT_9116 [Butyriboletus roseoflavus]
MAITKLLLLLVVVIAQLYAATAPNVRPPTEQLREQRGSEHAVPYLTAFIRTLISAWAFLEASVLFALSGYCPPALAHPFLHALLPPSPTSDLSPTTLTPTFLAGTLLSLTGALLRAHCFHTLGPHFTFELSIRPSHALVTKGVYSIVRHPSYTGGIALAVGWLLLVLDRRGWLVGVCARWAGGGSGDAVVTGVWACGWATALSVMYVLGNQRMNKEDAMLEKNFGEEWRAWTRRVPCRLVPGVY